MKSVLVQRLSLRCKFKSTDTIEIAVVDHDTGDCFIHQLSFRDFKKPEPIFPNENSNDKEIQDQEHLELETNIASDADNSVEEEKESE